MRALNESHAALDAAIEAKASDVHVSQGGKPWMRIGNDLIEKDYETDTLLGALKKISKGVADFAIVYKSRRWRVGLGTADGAEDAVLRLISNDLVPFTSLNLPEPFIKKVMQMEGLVLVTAPTGSGKSTTLNSVIDYINSHLTKKIITLEDPIEYLHTSKQSLIRQRELYTDFKTFDLAIAQSLRQDPDIIVVGEIRDLPTITAALTAAETGHLVFGTLHTRNASSALTRILDMAPERESAQLRAQLAQSLAAVLAQRLIPKVSGGRVPAFELLLQSPAVSSLISNNSLGRIQGEITSSGKNLGMVSMDQYIARLQKRGTISMEEALRACEDPAKLKEILPYA